MGGPSTRAASWKTAPSPSRRARNNCVPGWKMRVSRLTQFAERDKSVPAVLRGGKTRRPASRESSGGPTARPSFSQVDSHALCRSGREVELGCLLFRFAAHAALQLLVPMAGGHLGNVTPDLPGAHDFFRAANPTGIGS